MVNFAAITPHSPVLIPEIGKVQTSQSRKTIAAFEELAEALKKSQPHTVAIISPHGPMRYDKFTVNLEESFKGDFQNFGIYELPGASFLNNTPLARMLLDTLRKSHFPVEVIREQTLDYGTLVPLHYLFKPLEKKPKIITLTYTALDWEMHFQFGRALGQIFELAQQNIAVIASGDMSHRLSEESPAGYSPYGIKFDETLIDLLKKNETEKILALNPDFCTEAGECALRSLIVALGAIDHKPHTFTELSYESPFGVGYLTGKWRLG